MYLASRTELGRACMCIGNQFPADILVSCHVQQGHCAPQHAAQEAERGWPKVEAKQVPTILQKCSVSGVCGF